MKLERQPLVRSFPASTLARNRGKFEMHFRHGRAWLAASNRFVNSLALAALASSLLSASVAAQGMTPAEALETVRKTGRPLLAIASSPTCGPCLALKSIIHSNEELQPLLSKFVYLEMDNRSAEFEEFRSRFPGDYSGVPMVYMVRADGAVMYGQSGGMGESQLKILLDQGVRSSGDVLTPSGLKKVELAYQRAREQAEAGKLATALAVMHRIAELDSFAEVVLQAQTTRAELEQLISDWLLQLDARIAAGEAVHANAYRLAELYVNLPDSAPVLRSNTKRLLQHYESLDSTRTAVLQNKRLVRARLEERREMCDAALASYELVIQLEPSSPAAEFAKERSQVVAAKQKRKVTSMSGG